MNHSVVAPYLSVGTNLCCGAHADKLKEVGAQIDISLEYEKTEVPNMFSTFIWLPVPDHQAPTLEQLDVGTAVIAEAEEKGYRVYAHCKNGHGRSPTLAIAYFIRKGMSLDEAFAVVKEKRQEVNPTDAQWERLKEYEARLKNR